MGTPELAGGTVNQITASSHPLAPGVARVSVPIETRRGHYP